MATILLIDDDAGTRETMSLLLRIEGVNGSFAEDGHTGIASALNAPCDLVLIDLRLPDMSGVDVVTEHKSHGLRCPLIIITAFPEIQSCFKTAQAGADDYVEGPLFVEDLLALIRRWLEPVPLTCLSIGSRSEHAPERPDANERFSTGRHAVDDRVASAVRALEHDVRLPLSKVASQVNLSVSRLRHLFVKTTGQRMTQYKQRRRLDRTLALLRQTQRRVSEIAEDVGWEPASLAKVFRLRFDLTPTEYRAKHRSDRRSEGRYPI